MLQNAERHGQVVVCSNGQDNVACEICTTETTLSVSCSAKEVKRICAFIDGTLAPVRAYKQWKMGF